MNVAHNNQFLVSVIIPCFNHARHLSETLESLLSQDHANWEGLIVDDGSTDNSGEVAGQYAKKDSRFKYIYQHNQGLPSARNNGIKQAQGDFIQFLDADDLITPDKLSAQLHTFESNPTLDIVYSRYVCFSDQERNKTWTYSRVLINGNPVLDFAAQWEKELSIPIHCFLYRKGCFDKWGLFDERFIFGKEDWDLHLRFAAGKAQFGFADGPAAKYRVSNESMVRKDPGKMVKGRLMLYRKYVFGRYTAWAVRFVFMKRFVDEYTPGTAFLRRIKAALLCAHKH